MKPPDQVAADVLAEDVPEPVAGDRLMVGDGGQYRDVELTQIKNLLTDIRRGPDRRRIGGPGAEHPAGCHSGQLERPSLQVGGKVLHQKIDRDPLPHHPRQVFARHRRGTGKQHSLDPPHPFPPAQVRRQVSQLAVQVRLGAVLGHATPRKAGTCRARSTRAPHPTPPAGHKAAARPGPAKARLKGPWHRESETSRPPALPPWRAASAPRRPYALPAASRLRPDEPPRAPMRRARGGTPAAGLRPACEDRRASSLRPSAARDDPSQAPAPGRHRQGSAREPHRAAFPPEPPPRPWMLGSPARLAPYRASPRSARAEDPAAPGTAP